MARRGHGPPRGLAGRRPQHGPQPPRRPDGATQAVAQGLADLRQGNIQAAATWFQAAIAADPTHAQAHHRLAETLFRLGRPQDATGIGLKAMGLDPGDTKTAIGLASLLRGREISFSRLDPAIGAGILACLTHPAVNPEDFRLVAEAALKAWPPLAAAMAKHRDRTPSAGWCLSPAGRQVLSSPLLLAYLSRTLNTDPGLEALLAALRRCLALDGAILGRAPHMAPFAAALARQQRINEYVYPVPEDEAAAVAALADTLGGCEHLSADGSAALLVLALYGPLADRSQARRWVDQADRLAPAAAALVRETLAEDLALAATAQDIPVLTPIAGGVSADVRAQYEENPYPRWLSFKRPRPGAWQEELRTLAGRSDIAFAVAHPRVLIAGCGTGRQTLARSISYGPDAEILSIDLSRTSLAYAILQARRLGLDGIRFAQADLLALNADLAGTFDIIEAVGVLHHLARPLDGWRGLLALLRPGGFMRIGLYSSTGRRDINAIRADIRRRGIPATPDAIRAYRRELIRSDDPQARRVVAGIQDVHNLSGCRDLLFHVQEHQFTLPAIADALAVLGLRLFAFEHHRNMQGPLPGPADIDGWIAAEAANPDLFRAMYIFWCRKA
ncbi:MAG: methyltransferase domain-containing protein [Rhodospirillaceae bacterium]|nr:methyltransferase domain-containing protein [Rhodospirillaceae bacterium]